jgi:hypothetical protein
MATTTTPAADRECAEHGIAEVVALLQHPEDLARLPLLLKDAESRRRSARASVSAAAQARVDALGLGMSLLGKSHRHIAKLRDALARIDGLCAECAALVGGDQHDEAIRALSLAHGNARRVLGELDDVVDLPARAEAVQRAFLPPAPAAASEEEEEDEDEDDEHSGAGYYGGGGASDDESNESSERRTRGRGRRRLQQGDVVGKRHAGELFRAFEGLTVIEGTANNSKEAWRRSAAARGGGGGGFVVSSGGAPGAAGQSQHQARNPDGLRELNQYLACVSKAMANFERRLWARLRDFDALADHAPGLLVDAARVVQAQEAMDTHWAVVRASYVRPKHWKER